MIQIFKLHLICYSFVVVVVGLINFLLFIMKLGIYFSDILNFLCFLAV